MSCTTCTKDHLCRQGRGCTLNQRPGFELVDTSTLGPARKPYAGPERRIPFDSRLAKSLLVLVLAFWGVVGWAIWERL